MTFFTLVALLPQLIGLIFKFIDLMNKKAGQDAAAYLTNINSSLDIAMTATTPEDHAKAAKAIALALAGKTQ